MRPIRSASLVLSPCVAILCLAGFAGVAGLVTAQSDGDPSLVYIDFAAGDGREGLRVESYSPQERSVPVGREADLLLSAELQPVIGGRQRWSNPDVAIGPEDILVVAGQNRILRLPNPNTTGASLPYSAGSTPSANLNAVRAAGGVSEVSLDTWVGSTVLNDICPGTFNPQTCLIQYPTVRYDQIHGHFVVAFSITDTGVRGTDSIVTQGRVSTWVLILSKRASFVAPDGTVPANVFALPGGGLTADWFIYYGRRDTAGPGQFLNLNMYSTHPTALPLSAPGRYSASFPESNCNAPAGAQPPLSVSAPAGEETVCLFPTEVRLGIDAESIILSSPVMNVNQIVPNSNAIAFTTGRHAGNRVRVLSKYALYNAFNLVNGNWFVPGAYTAPSPFSGDGGASGVVNPPSQTQFDMFRNTDLPAFCSVFDFATDTCTTFVAGFPPRRYTLGLEVSPTGSGIDTPRPPADPATASALYPLYYEPAHLRGRALAKYSNYPYGGYTHLLGSYAFGTVGSGGNLWVQAIVYRPDYRPALDAGDQTAIGIAGPRRQLVPDTVINPLQAPQATTCTTTPCSGGGATDPQNLLYIGDSRPQRAIYREGRLYDARNGRPSSNVYGTSLDTPVANNANTANPVLSSTVYYDTIQTLYTSATPALPAVGSTAVFTLPLTNPSLTFYGFWQNGHFYNPMFDVPANVQRSGAVSPTGAPALLDKLYVGTTSPRVAQPNPAGQGNKWPSLFDIRQGLDKYDRFDFFTDPVSGRVINPVASSSNTTNLFSTRHGASTDPIRGGLWTYGAFSDTRLLGVGQWATHANYTDMTFKRLDAYDGGPNFFADVCPPGQGDFTCLDNGFFPYIQSAKQIGLTEYLYGAGGLPLVQVDPGHGFDGTAVAFQPLRRVTRAELAALVVYSVMDEDAVGDYLGKTALGLGNSFTDVPGASGSDPDGFPAIVSEDQRRAIEVLTRRGYAAGCGGTSFCPFAFATRGDAAEWIMKAKLSNVHPGVIANNWTATWVDATPYFPIDVSTGHPQFSAIQFLRRFRITNGNGIGIYSPAELVSRQAIATFIVKAFHF